MNKYKRKNCVSWWLFMFISSPLSSVQFSLKKLYWHDHIEVQYCKSTLCKVQAGEVLTLSSSSRSSYQHLHPGSGLGRSALQWDPAAEGGERQSAEPAEASDKRYNVMFTNWARTKNTSRDFSNIIHVVSEKIQVKRYVLSSVSPAEGSKEAEQLMEAAAARLKEVELEAERWAEQSRKLQTDAEAHSQEIAQLKQDRLRNQETINRWVSLFFLCFVFVRTSLQPWEKDILRKGHFASKSNFSESL